jgi:hypothetical protein
MLPSSTANESNSKPGAKVASGAVVVCSVVVWTVVSPSIALMEEVEAEFEHPDPPTSRRSTDATAAAGRVTFYPKGVCI